MNRRDEMPEKRENIDGFLTNVVLPAIASKEEIEERIRRVEQETADSTRDIAEVRRIVRDHICCTETNENDPSVSPSARDTGNDLRRN